jgi:hypothetical protein
MDEASKIFVDNFGFGLGIYLSFLIVFLATKVFLDTDGSMLGNTSIADMDNFKETKRAAWAALELRGEYRSDYCSEECGKTFMNEGINSEIFSICSRNQMNEYMEKNFHNGCVAA